MTSASLQPFGIFAVRSLPILGGGGMPVGGAPIVFGRKFSRHRRANRFNFLMKSIDFALFAIFKSHVAEFATRCSSHNSMFYLTFIQPIGYVLLAAYPFDPSVAAARPARGGNLNGQA